MYEDGEQNKEVLARSDLIKESLSEKLPYREIKRGFGAGELRLAKSLEFG
jgi:hypothetical protein